MRQQLVDEGYLLLGFLVPAARFLDAAFLALLHRGQVGQNQLVVDNLDVAHGVDTAQLVDDVVVLEAAHHLHDGVRLADVG